MATYPSFVCCDPTDLITANYRSNNQIYYATKSIMNPGIISISALAMMQQTASSVRETFSRITDQKSSLHENLHHIEALYDGLKIKNTTSDGLLPYPPFEEKDNTTMKGMAISVRYVLLPISSTTPPPPADKHPLVVMYHSSIPDLPRKE